jgi:glycerophosphoryl diester phosphodiesterase
MVEVDVKLTADGRPVLFHDDLLDRTSDGEGPVAETLLDELGALDAGSWFGPDFVGEAIPTLEEALEALIDNDLTVNLEIKPCPGREEETARAALAVAQPQWPSDRAAPLISSFSRACLSVARDKAPDWPRALICDSLPEDWREVAAILRLTAIHLADSAASPASVAEVTKAGLAVAVYTVNEPQRATFLWAAGVAAVFSDRPAVILGAVQ